MTKRCKNCGWPNDDNNMTCQKCGSPLDGSMSNPAPTLRPSSNDGGDSGESMRRTVSEKQFFGTSNDSSSNNEEPTRPSIKKCPKCHYQVREGMNNCPNCGASLTEQMPDKPVNAGKRCPKCGSQNPSESNFCCQCGTRFDAPVQGPVNPPMAPVNMGGAHGGTVNPWMQPNAGAFCTLKPIAWNNENVQYQPLSFSGKSIILNRANTDPNNQSITSAEQAELTFEDGEWFIVDKSAMHTTYVMAGRKLKLEKGDTIILGNRLFEFNG